MYLSEKPLIQIDECFPGSGGTSPTSPPNPSKAPPANDADLQKTVCLSSNENYGNLNPIMYDNLELNIQRTNNISCIQKLEELTTVVVLTEKINVQIDNMRAADSDKATKYVLNWGSHESHNSDVSKDPCVFF